MTTKVREIGDEQASENGSIDLVAVLFVEFRNGLLNTWNAPIKRKKLFTKTNIAHKFVTTLIPITQGY